MKLVTISSRVVFLLLITSVSVPAFAQNSSGTEAERVKAIYEATKTAKSAKDYTNLLESCEKLLAVELTDKNRKYITSLTGWALNRRGGLRLETAEQLKAVGNAQADEAIAQAMSDFDEAIKADPNRWRSWLSRGIAYVSQEKLELAIEDFNKVIGPFW